MAEDHPCKHNGTIGEIRGILAGHVDASKERHDTVMSRIDRLCGALEKQSTRIDAVEDRQAADAAAAQACNAEQDNRISATDARVWRLALAIAGASAVGGGSVAAVAQALLGGGAGG